MVLPLPLPLLPLLLLLPGRHVGAEWRVGARVWTGAGHGAGAGAGGVWGCRDGVATDGMMGGNVSLQGRARHVWYDARRQRGAAGLGCWCIAPHNASPTHDRHC